MKAALLVLLAVTVLVSCTRAGRLVPASGDTRSRDGATVPSATGAPSELVYYPNRDRALSAGDDSSPDVRWHPLGLDFPALLTRTLYALVLSDTPLMDRDGNSRGILVTAGTRVRLLEAGDWVGIGRDFHRLYRVQVMDTSQTGWLHSSETALILAEANGLQVGVMPRKIAIGGGESEYSILVVADGRRASIVDTSYFPFPDGFHPSGVVDVSLQDVNADSRAEIILEAESIVSLSYLGATPVRWKAWLRRRGEELVPIFRYNESYGSDSGYSYAATDRLFDSSGGGFQDIVRVDTAFTVSSGPDEFRTSTVSFYPWNGSEFRRAALQDLPKLGTVSSEHLALRAQPGEDGPQVVELTRGDQLFIVDRSDRRQFRDDPSSWWYRAVTRRGAEGWVSGMSVDLSWIDPMKVNRTTFLHGN